jgi:alpha-tubulin suppressor-like RCC1 family protein
MKVASRALLGKNLVVNPLAYLCWAAFASLCCVFTIRSATITYPNQAYSFSHDTSSPVPGTLNVKAVAVEGTRIMAVTRDGRVVTSGFPETWLADGTVDRLTNVVSVGLNDTGGAVLTADGRVIEVGSTSEHPPVLTNAIAIDASGQFEDDDLDFKLAVTSDGRVVVWTLHEFTTPSSIEIPGVITAAAGWNHIVALKSDGTVVEWDLGNTPSLVAGLSNVVAVAAGGNHSVALKADGTVVAWGQNFLGQTDVPAGLSNVVAISAAEYHTLALKSDGTLVAWGQFYYGQGVIPPQNLSNVVAIATSAVQDVVITTLPGPPPITYLNQAYTFSNGPFAPVPDVFNVNAVAVEGERIMAVTSDGRVVTHGFPPNWLADGTLDRITNAVAVGLNYTGGAVLTDDGRVIEVGRPSFQKPEINNAIAIDVSGQFNDDDLDFKIAVTSDQRVVAWGLYEFSSPPSAEIPGLHSAAAGWNHIVALIQDGTVVEWDVDTLPTVVPGVSNVVKVAAGGEHSVALKNDGTVVAWGENFFGQTDVPAGLSNVVAISAAEYHTLALKADGTLVAWGKLYLGQDVIPPQNLSNVVAIATSASQDVVISYLRQPATLGITTDGSDPNKAIISLSGAPNREYLIEASADFVNWQFVRNVLNLTGSTTFPVETTEASLRFFRAR